MKNKQLFIDFSMMGYNPEQSVMLDCSVGVVDTKKMVSTTPYTVKTAFAAIKRFKLNIADQQRLGYTMCSDGIEYWKKQPKAIIDRTVKPSPNDLTVDQFTTKFIDFVSEHGNVDTWWSWNSMDDAAILWRLFKGVNKERVIHEHLPRWKSRDMITLIDSKFDFKLNDLRVVPIDDVDYWNAMFVDCDSSFDVVSNILRMQAIFRAENDLENIQR